MRTPGGEDRTGYRRRKTRSWWSHPVPAICIPAMPVFKPRSCSPAPLQWAPPPPPLHKHLDGVVKFGGFVPTKYCRQIIINWQFAAIYQLVNVIQIKSIEVTFIITSSTPPTTPVNIIYIPTTSHIHKFCHSGAAQSVGRTNCLSVKN